MTTLADVRAACRLTIASTAIVDATLDGWIADALRFHSVQFPRRARVDLDCTAGTQEYDLPSDVGDIYRVLGGRVSPGRRGASAADGHAAVAAHVWRRAVLCGGDGGH